MDHIAGANQVGHRILAHWKKRNDARLEELHEAGTLADRLLSAQAEVTRQLDAVKARLEKEDPLHDHPTMLDRIDYYKLIEANAWEEVVRSIPAP